MPLAFQSKPVAPDKEERLRKWLSDPALQDILNHLEAAAVELEIAAIDHAGMGSEGHDKLAKDEIRKAIDVRKAMRLLRECHERKYNDPFLTCVVAVKL